jgi:outer membrane biogenesis lipoprotein LolB
MKAKRILSVMISVVLCAALLAACSAKNTESPDNTTGSTEAAETINTVINNNSTSGTAMVSVRYDTEDYYFDWKNQNYQTINLDNGSAEITKSGIYELTGTAKDGNLTVNVDKSADKGIVYLIFNNINISSTTAAPIYIGCKKDRYNS